MHLIGINGFKRSGKGTVAEAVSALYNDGAANVVQVGFADKLKVLAGLTLGFERSHEELIALADSMKVTGGLYVHYDEPNGPSNVMHDETMREFYQNLGNEMRGLFGDSFWVDQVLPNPNRDAWSSNGNALKERYPDADVVCITDLRYPNEAERVLALGGVVWEVIRPGTGSDGHASEQPLPRDLVTEQIDNSGGLMDLEIEVERVMNRLPLR